METSQSTKKRKISDVNKDSGGSSDEEETYTFQEWVVWSKGEIGYTSLKNFLVNSDTKEETLRDDLEIKMLNLSQSITVATEQISLKNLLPHGFSAEYDHANIKDGTVMYSGNSLTDKRALQYVALFQLAMSMHAFSTIILPGGAALIVQPFHVIDGKYITNASVLKLTSGDHHTLHVTANILLGITTPINPFHYKQTSTKAVVCNRYFSEYKNITEEHMDEIQAAVEDSNRTLLLERGAVVQKGAFQHWIRELETLMLTSSSIEELCQKENLDTFTLPQLLHMVTTQQRLKNFFKTKNRKFYLNNDTTNEVVGVKLSEVSDDQEIVVTTSAMSYVEYSRLHADLEVLAVPAGTKQLFFIGKGKTREVYSKTIETTESVGPKTLCDALNSLAEVRKSKRSESKKSASSAKNTTSSKKPIVIKVDASLFDA